MIYRQTRQTTPLHVTLVGNYWNGSLNTGPLNWNLNNESTRATRNIDGHSLYTKEKRRFVCLGSCQNINPNPNRLVALGRKLVRCKGL